MGVRYELRPKGDTDDIFFHSLCPKHVDKVCSPNAPSPPRSCAARQSDLVKSCNSDPRQRKKARLARPAEQPARSRRPATSPPSTPAARKKKLQKKQLVFLGTRLTPAQAVSAPASEKRTVCRSLTAACAAIYGEARRSGGRHRDGRVL